MSRSTWAARLMVGAVALASIAVGAAPAQAAVPDAKGWVLWNQAAAAPVAFGTWPAATTVVQLAVGRYQIRFPGQAASGGVVHITAINTSPRWCQAENWFPAGVDEIANVRCYQVGGALASTSFSAFFTKSSGGPVAGAYGYVDSQAGGAIISQYNSTGGVNTSVNGAVGQWLVHFPGLVTGNNLDGGLQATAVNTGVGARCKIAWWASTGVGQNVMVLCFNAAGAPLNTRFTLTYQHKVSLYGATIPPKYHGYFFNQPPAGPVTTNFNAVLGFGVNTIAAAGIGLSLVTFPAVGFPQNTVQVTAHGTTSNFCGLSNFWTNTSALNTVVRNVNCFTNAGAPVNTGFLISTSSIL